MAKKAKKKPTPNPKPRLVKTGRKAKTVKAPPPRAARKSGPRSQALPGMEEVRYKDLDAICESIAETREAINRYKGEEADLERQALIRMRNHSRETYTWSGVMLVRVPGEEKLLVRNARQRTATSAAEERDGNSDPDTTADASAPTMWSNA